MKTYILFLLSLISPFIYSQSQTKEIYKIEICAVEYDATFYMPPLLDELKIMCLNMMTTDSEIKDSGIEKNIAELETKASYMVDPMHIEGNTRALVILTYKDGTSDTLYILGAPDCDIVWKNRQYKFYYPLVESVYYFYPERYFDKESNWNHYRRIQERENVENNSQ